MLETLMLAVVLGGVAVPDANPDALQYQVAGRRDPFVNPTADLGFSHKHDRCGTGLKAFFAEELTMRGTVRVGSAFTAALSSSDGRTYFARAGQALCDGVIAEIAPGTVIVQQGSRVVRLQLPR